MKWLKKLRNLSSGTYKPARWLIETMFGGKSDSGVAVTPGSALTYRPVWQALNLISGDVAKLPIPVYKRTDEQNKNKDRSHPGLHLMTRRPNRYMGAFTFKQTLQAHALMWGNGYAEIMRNPSTAEPLELIPLLPDRTWPEIDGDGRLWYITTVQNGEQRKLRPENVLHIKGLGFDGLKGYSVITLARNSWGFGMAAHKYGAGFYARGAAPLGVLEHPEHLEKEEVENIRRGWNEIHEGLENSHRVAILWEGMKFKTMQLSHKDQQFFELLDHSLVEVAGWFLLPPHKLGHMGHATWGNVEHENQDYLDTCLMIWLKTWEEECNAKLLTERQKLDDSHFFEFNTAALLRGDFLSRMQAYSQAIQARILNPNECRGFENWNAYEGGDEYFNPVISTQEAEDDPAEDEPAEDKGKAKDRVAALVAVECRRVKHASQHAANFTGWVESFYSRWPDTLREAFEDEGLPVDLAEQHAHRSKSDLLDLLGTVTPAELPGKIDALLGSWPARTDELLALAV